MPKAKNHQNKKSPPSESDRALSARIKFVWQSRGESPSQAELGERYAERYGKGSQSMVSQYMNGNIKVNFRVAQFFAEQFGCDIREFGRDWPELESESSYRAQATTTIAVRDESRSDEIRIPRFDVRGSMGIGIPAPDQETIIGTLAVSLSWLRNEFRQISSPEKLAVVTGYGDSMEGTFNDGAQLIVDRGVSEVKVDAVYVLALNDQLYIKRLQRRPNGSLLMISDNRKYEPYLIEDGERHNFRVLGRVVGVWNFTKL